MRCGVASDEDTRRYIGEPVIDRNERATAAQIMRQRGARSVRWDCDRQVRALQSTRPVDQLDAGQDFRVEMDLESNRDVGLGARSEEKVPDTSSESGQGVLLGREGAIGLAIHEALFRALGRPAWQCPRGRRLPRVRARTCCQAQWGR
jgi:hypothetical protein